MKKLIIFSLFAFVAFAVNAQRIDKNYVCSTCTVIADTVSAETTYYTYANPIKTFDGVLGFVFTKTDITDSCSVLLMQGAMTSDFAAPIDLTGTAALTNTTTDGTSFLYVTNPIFLYYRLKVTTASGDAVKFQNVKLIYK